MDSDFIEPVGRHNQTIEIDPVKEIQHLEAMYKHYKILYRKLWFLCCSNERKVAKHNRDEYRLKFQQAVVRAL